MKKAIAIIILGLLLSSNAFAGSVENKCFGYQGYGDLSQNKSNKTWIEVIDTENKTFKWKYPGESWQPSKNTIIFMNNEIMKSKHKDFESTVTYNFITFKETMSGASGYFQNDCVQVSSVGIPKKQEKSTNTANKIDQAKQICKDLGFKTNTEKFADCSLKMLSIQFEVKNRESQSEGKSQQQIIVRQGYSVGDAMIALSGIISDANRSSSSSGTNCRIFQKHWGADMVCN